MGKAAAGGNREAWGKRPGKRLCTRLARVRNQTDSLTDHSGLPEVPAGGPISGEGRVFGGGDARTHVVAAGTTRGGRDVEDVVAVRGAPRLRRLHPLPGHGRPEASPRRGREAAAPAADAAEARLRVRVQRVRVRAMDRRRDPVDEERRAARRPAPHLSLIHISEPTRPY